MEETIQDAYVVISKYLAGTGMATGRPREFDKGEALDKALNIFWQKGYEGASVADLTKAMGIKPPSLYAAFGNKEGLLREVLDRYENGPASYADAAMGAPTARETVALLLHGAAALIGDKRHPGGCFFVTTALAGSAEAEPVKRELSARRKAGELSIRRRLERGKKEGDLPADANPAALARYINTLIRGLSVEALDGASARELHQIADIALATLPLGK
ncbi:MAG: TetR/AcrR family transcriptional regulator [Parvibaculaceae bacterium]